MSYGFYGAVNVIITAGATSLITTSGAAPLTIGGVMTLSFSSTLALKAIVNYVLNGRVKTHLKTVEWVVAVPVIIFQWSLNLITGGAEKLIFKKRYDFDIVESLGIPVGPKAVEFGVAGLDLEIAGLNKLRTKFLIIII